MVQSINTKFDLIADASAFYGMNNYGKVMIGDKGFEFYNGQKLRDYIQIPWEEIEYVAALVLGKGRYIPRFAIYTRENGAFCFAARRPKEVLRAMNKYVASEKMVRSLSLLDVIKRNIIALNLK